MFSVDEYLARIGWTGPTRPDSETLAGLHEAHMYAVPFENLDIHRGRPLSLDEERLFEKLVRDRRGGFCYELNGAFAGLLRRLGFEVTMLSARVTRAAGGFGPEFDHMALLVTIAAQRWLADVGFGDSFRRPLRLDDDRDQTDGDPREIGFRLVRAGDEITLLRRDDGWKPEYVFTLTPREMPEYAEMCHYHQTSSASSFTLRLVCSRAIPEGRITLTGETFIRTTAAGRSETPVSAESWPLVLEREFGVVLPERARPSIRNS